MNIPSKLINKFYRKSIRDYILYYSISSVKLLLLFVLLLLLLLLLLPSIVSANISFIFNALTVTLLED